MSGYHALVLGGNIKALSTAYFSYLANGKVTPGKMLIRIFFN